MKRARTIIVIIAVFAGAAAAATRTPAKETGERLPGRPAESYANKSQARISMKRARALALAQVPGGRIKSGELERERGKLIYSFDIRTRAGIREVNIDAMTGKVIEVKTESAASEASEGRKERQERKRKNATPNQ